MIQHRGPPIASPVFCCKKPIQSSKARTKPCLPLQAASSEAVAIIKSRIIVHNPSHAVQSIFCNPFIDISTTFHHLFTLLHHFYPHYKVFMCIFASPPKTIKELGIRKFPSATILKISKHLAFSFLPLI